MPGSLTPSFTTVAVAIATRDRENLLPYAVASVSRQTWPGHIELTVVDDGSKAPVSLTELRPTHNVTLSVVRNQFSRGLATARNRVIHGTQAPFFTFLDDDDEWPSDFLENMFRPFYEYSVEAVFGYPYHKIPPVLSRNPAPLTDLFIAGATPPVGAQLYRTSLVKAVGGYNERIRSGVDHDLWVRSLERNPLCAALPNVIVSPLTSIAVPRMTNSRSRLKRILSSLAIWHDTIQRILGQGFFRHFKQEYVAHVLAKLLRARIEQGAWINASTLFFQHPVIAMRLATRRTRTRLTKARSRFTFDSYNS